MPIMSSAVSKRKDSNRTGPRQEWRITSDLPQSVRESPKRIGWHTLRHTFGTLVKSQGADVATTQALMRHANVSITMDRYVQAVGEQKRQAQHSVVGLLAPNGPTALTIPPASC